MISSHRSKDCNFPVVPGLSAGPTKALAYQEASPKEFLLGHTRGNGTLVLLPAANEGRMVWMDEVTEARTGALPIGYIALCAARSVIENNDEKECLTHLHCAGLSGLHSLLCQDSGQLGLNFGILFVIKVDLR
jgi:hypothetical protein